MGLVQGLGIRGLSWVQRKSTDFSFLAIAKYWSGLLCGIPLFDSSPFRYYAINETEF